jgi:hypothetical protein
LYKVDTITLSYTFFQAKEAQDLGIQWISIYTQGHSEDVFVNKNAKYFSAIFIHFNCL